MKIIYVGNFTQPHCTEVHIARTLENMGHQVTRVQEDPKNKRTLISTARGHDMFLFTRTWSNLVTLDHLRQLKDMGIPTVSYHLDLYVGLQRGAGIDTDPFWRTEYVFSPDGDPASQAYFEERGINHHYLKPGVFLEECVRAEPNHDPELSGDVIFVGGGLEYNHPEWPYRHQLVQWLMDNYPTQYKKFGHPQRTVRNAELNILYANSKIVIGDSLCLNFNHPYYWSDRVYETIGRGGFIIHPFIEGMQEEFTDGENIAFYKFNDWDGLRRQIDYYLSNDAERNRIRDNGFEFVKNHATYNNRLEEVLSVVFSTPHLTKEEEQELVDTINNTPTLQPIYKKINLGAGEDQKEGFINVDLVDLPGIDVVHNLMEFPYPFEDGSADEIHAVDVIEHLANYTPDSRPSAIAFVEECHRILKPGGVLYMQTPGWRAEFLWIDPTHVRPFDIQSFDFFDPTTHFGQTTGFYSKVKFSVKAEELPNHNLRFWMTKI